jgi:hypothetical protein
MKRLALLLLSLAAAFAAGSGASADAGLGSQVIFSNLGPPGPTYYCCLGWLVTGSGTFYRQVENANAFTPSQNTYITQIDVAVSHASGTNNMTLELVRDDGGLPGSVLRSWSLANQPPIGTCCALTTIRVGSRTAVLAGRQYWLVAIAGPNSLNDTVDGWNFTWNGAQTGPVMSNYDGAGWIQVGYESGAFDVLGVPCGKLCRAA